MSNIILILVLIYESICDIKYQRIRLMPLVAAGIAGIGLGLLCEGKSWSELLIGAIPGVVTLLAGLITRQNIGYGDGVIIFVAGLLLGWRSTLVILWVALVFAGIVGLLLVFIKKRGRNARIALCPYILLATIIYMILGAI